MAKNKLLTILIPVYNEESTISDIIKRVQSAKTPGFDKQVIIIDDGSKDRTQKILKSIKLSKMDTKIIHKNNLGKGAAIRSALPHVRGDYVIIQDADLEYNPDDYTKLLKKVSDRTVVFGSRNRGHTSRGYFVFYQGGKLLSTLFNVVYGTDISDVTTCYKLWPSSLISLNDLTRSDFTFEIELAATFAKKGIPIKEVPISYSPRTFAEGKKIKPIDGIKSMWAIIRFRF
jgi:dolichol-phosphate mannosyltransferase